MEHNKPILLVFSTENMDYQSDDYEVMNCNNITEAINRFIQYNPELVLIDTDNPNELCDYSYVPTLITYTTGVLFITNETIQNLDILDKNQIPYEIISRQETNLIEKKLKNLEIKTKILTEIITSEETTRKKLKKRIKEKNLKIPRTDILPILMDIKKSLNTDIIKFNKGQQRL